MAKNLAGNVIKDQKISDEQDQLFINSKMQNLELKLNHIERKIDIIKILKSVLIRK